MISFDSISLEGSVTLEIPITKETSNSNGYIVRSIDGLGPTEFNLVIADMAIEGGLFQNRRAHNREVTIMLEMRPDFSEGQTVGYLRQKLYNFISSTTGGAIDFCLLNDDVHITRNKCWIKKIEPSLFSKETIIQLVLSFDSPYLISNNETIVPIPNDTDELTFENLGTAPSMPSILSLDIPAEKVSVNLTTNGSTFGFYSPGNFQSGDSVVIKTTVGDRSITRYRSIYRLNLLPYLLTTVITEWPTIIGGSNVMTLAFNQTFSELRYRANYWGV